MLVVDVETDTIPSGYDTKKSVMMNILSHRIIFLKRISQDAYSIFINLQSSEQVCKDAMGWLESIFQQWGLYMQFFDRLIPLLAKNPNLPDKVIIVKEGMDKVKDLLQFFTRK